MTLEKIFQKNKYYIFERRKLKKCTLLQKITNFLDDHIETPLNKNNITNNLEILILEADNEKIKFRKAFDKTEYDKSLKEIEKKEIEKNFTSREIIDREYLDLEIKDNFQCRNNPNLISLHQAWEYEYQKKHLFALTDGKIINQIRIPYMNIDNFYLDWNFILFLISLIVYYLIYSNNFHIDRTENANLFIIGFGIIFLFTYLINYNLVKEYERELEYRIEKQRVQTD